MVLILFTNTNRGGGFCAPSQLLNATNEMMEVILQAGVLWIQEFDVTSVVGDLDAAFLVSLVSLVVVQLSRFRRWCTRQIAFLGRSC